MMKNGTFFISIEERSRVRPSVWDPYFYRGTGINQNLGEYVTVARPKTLSTTRGTQFSPIEYRHISKDRHLSFSLQEVEDSEALRSKWPLVGELELLFGTMRAYLGNVLVTPKAKWLNLAGPLLFPVKSEFLQIRPFDNCLFFWWAYFQAPTFLANLPLGSGGTRPRLHQEALLLTPVSVPSLDARTYIHNELVACAEREWKEYRHKIRILSSLSF